MFERMPLWRHMLVHTCLNTCHAAGTLAWPSVADHSVTGPSVGMILMHVCMPRLTQDLLPPNLCNRIARMWVHSSSGGSCARNR
eukprot:53076-Chlamydomonas_euryale.AAC.4